METTLQALILGIVEGLTEFLPVSSTGHMILTGELIGFTGDKAKTFEIVVQLGSILAIVVMFWRKLIGMFNPKKISMEEFRKPTGLNLLHITLGMVPALLVAYLLHDLIKEYLFEAYWVVFSLVLGALLMIFAELYAKNRRIVSPTVDDLSYKQALSIGLFQCLALWPGFSRSGSTISGGLIVGTSHKAAAEFSFMMAVPIMVIASGYDLLKSRDLLSMSDLPMFATGFVAAFVVALLAVFSFLKILEKVKLTPFAIYRIILAAVFWFYLYG